MPREREPFTRCLFRLYAASLCALLAAGCADRMESDAQPMSRPVKIFVVEDASQGGVRTFPGRVDASQRAELAFRVSGRLQEMNVREGDLVDAGEVLARLDPTDYALVLEDRQARYDNAERNYNRARDLIQAGNISRLDFDRMEADYRSASAALSTAKKDLEYTVLASPFSGRIAQRAVENFEEVLAKQTVFWLQNVGSLDVIIDLPESVLRSVRGSTAREALDGEQQFEPAPPAFARFEGRGEQSFELVPKEIATKADEQTQTYRATFTMEAPTNFTVLPGMTATVEVDLSDFIADENVTWVPARSVQADSGLNPRVWVLNPANMTVSSKPVTIGRMSGRMIEITDGLEGGEEIVAVGAPYLAEGMSVTRMAQSEQAQPRDGDPT